MTSGCLVLYRCAGAGYYNSARNTVACPLGWGQTHDYDRTLTYDLDGMHYTDPFGAEVAFPPLEVGEDAVNAGLLLRRVTERTYEVVQAGEPVQNFEFSGGSDTAPLRRLRQGEGQITFDYGSNSRLCEIVRFDWALHCRRIGPQREDTWPVPFRRLLAEGTARVDALRVRRGRQPRRWQGHVQRHAWLSLGRAQPHDLPELTGAATRFISNTTPKVGVSIRGATTACSRSSLITSPT